MGLDCIMPVNMGKQAHTESELNEEIYDPSIFEENIKK